MFPLRDNIRSRTFPFVNYALILANLAVFFYEWQLAQTGALESFMMRHALVPAKFFHAPLVQIPTIFKAMFIHGGWGHVIGNMWFLTIFGDNVEDRVGHIRYLFYYLLMGVGGAAVQLWADPHSHLPMVGASGAIAGILGSYIVLYPKARIETFFIFIIFIRVIEIPAFFYLGLWFLTQALNGFGSLGAPTVRGEMGGVAWWAHIGGFISGFIGILFFKKRGRSRS